MWCVQELAVVHMQSARTIQAAFRGHQAREKRRDEEQGEQEMDDMATRVQALYRSVRPHARRHHHLASNSLTASSPPVP